MQVQQSKKKNHSSELKLINRLLLAFRVVHKSCDRCIMRNGSTLLFRETALAPPSFTGDLLTLKDICTNECLLYVGVSSCELETWFFQGSNPYGNPPLVSETLLLIRHLLCDGRHDDGWVGRARRLPLRSWWVLLDKNTYKGLMLNREIIEHTLTGMDFMHWLRFSSHFIILF